MSTIHTQASACNSERLFDEESRRFTKLPTADLGRLIFLNRIRSACVQMRFYLNELELVGIELEGGLISPDEAENILDDLGATPLLNAAVGLQ